LQDFCDGIQSSQIGPHLVQPLSARPTATTLKITANRLNILCVSGDLPIIRPEVWHFQAAADQGALAPRASWNEHNRQTVTGNPSMQDRPKAEGFDIEQARRILGDVFAPWVQDLGLSIDGVECDPPPGAPADWQPGAVLRMAFSERLCRHGGIVCGQALMAFADTSMVIAMVAANRGYRPMTTVDQTTHFMRAASQSDVVADARVVRLGRTMSFGRVTLSSATDNKAVAMVSSAFAML
jgi:uncharacterized protein (TIGR00369 family)